MASMTMTPGSWSVESVGDDFAGGSGDHGGDGRGSADHDSVTMAPSVAGTEVVAGPGAAVGRWSHDGRT